MVAVVARYSGEVCNIGHLTILYPTNGCSCIRASSKGALDGEVVDEAGVVACTRHVAEQTAIGWCSTVDHEVGDCMTITVEITFEGVSGGVTYHSPRLVARHIEVADDFEIDSREIEAIVHKHGKAVKLSLVTD